MHISSERRWSETRINWAGVMIIIAGISTLSLLFIFPIVGKTVLALCVIFLISALGCDIRCWWKDLPRPIFSKTLPTQQTWTPVDEKFKEKMDWNHALKSLGVIVGILIFLFVFYSSLIKIVMWFYSHARALIG